MTLPGSSVRVGVPAFSHSGDHQLFTNLTPLPWSHFFIPSALSLGLHSSSVCSHLETISYPRTVSLSKSLTLRFISLTEMSTPHCFFIRALPEICLAAFSQSQPLFPPCSYCGLAWLHDALTCISGSTNPLTLVSILAAQAQLWVCLAVDLSQAFSSRTAGRF